MRSGQSARAQMKDLIDRLEDVKPVGPGAPVRAPLDRAAEVLRQVESGTVTGRSF
ncbi:hypothetical protein [Streptomyces sp. NPDC017673]|uniref:hypothetical protein n=1 Tax=unclassified Streptomyces TaxID=2593676 RepID=UPI0037B0A36B